MGQVVGVFNTSHTPFCYRYPHIWNQRRAQRSIREDVPLDDLETSQLKYERIQTSFATLRSKMEALDPDVVVVIGDDQAECFNFSNFPAFAVYVGEEFTGPLARKDIVDPVPDPNREYWGTRKGHPELAVGLLTGLMQRGFDPAFCMDLPNPERGLGHAILRPAESVIPETTPIVPILLNCYYAPQVSGTRAYQLGAAIRDTVENLPSDLRVAVVGSGGLWHAQGYGPAYLNEDFDKTVLGYVESGDAKGLGQFFDDYVMPDAPTRSRGHTGMPSPGGPQGGTRETCNWIAATAAGGGIASEIVDYVPVYASPIGVAFTHSSGI